MYAKCGELQIAQALLKGSLDMRRRGLQSSTELIKHSVGKDKVVNVKGPHSQQAKEEKKDKVLAFSDSNHQKIHEDTALVALLRDCAKRNNLHKGSRLHADILKRGSLTQNVFVGNTLVNMYAKCGALVKARQVFDELILQNVVSWTALIAGYAEHGYGEEALNCFEQMQLQGLSPDEHTFACILKACASLKAAAKGEDIHAKIAQKGWLRRNIVLGNACVDMFAKCRGLEKAQQVFDELPFRNIISWNALITGYAQQGKGEEALDCYERMQHAGLSPNAVTFACILKACGSIVAVEKGEEIHAEVARKGLLGRNSVVGTALVDMYVKFGALAKAQVVFDRLTFRNVVSWTALLAGYAQVGSYDAIFDSFDKMIAEGVEPNLVTFVIVLNACSYLGLVNEGQTYFESMTASYGIVPAFEHHTCMVDLLACAGHFDKALRIIKEMPSFDYLPAWSVLLSACERWGNVRIGRLAFENAVRLDEKSSVAYVWMSSIYAAAGMQADAEKIEAMRIEKATLASGLKHLCFFF